MTFRRLDWTLLSQMELPQLSPIDRACLCLQDRDTEYEVEQNSQGLKYRDSRSEQFLPAATVSAGFLAVFLLLSTTKHDFTEYLRRHKLKFVFGKGQDFSATWLIF
jgi:hypothetical protein